MPERILVLTESFEQGGLETYILGQARVLSQLGVELLLATGSTGKHVPRGVFPVHMTDLALGPNVTLADLRVTIDRIREFSHTHRATLLHAHPCHSMNVGFLAAQASGLPLVLTLHGPWSLEGVRGPLPELLLQAGALRHAARTYCVSQEVLMLCRAAGGRGTILPNSAMVPHVTHRLPGYRRKWMWAGRIDDLKATGLLDLVSKMRGLGCELHIYGDGSGRGTVEEFVRDNAEVASFVQLRGWTDDLSATYPKYDVVSGMGRVLIEAGALGVRCLLVGYDGVKGFLRTSQMARAAYSNFSGRGLETIGTDQFLSSLNFTTREDSSLDISQWITKQRNEDVVWRQYLDDVENLSPLQSQFATDCLEALSFHGEPKGAAWFSDKLFGTVAGMAGPDSDSALRSVERRMSLVLIEETRRRVEALALQQDGIVKALQDRMAQLISERDTHVREAVSASAELHQARAERETYATWANRLMDDASRKDEAARATSVRDENRIAELSSALETANAERSTDALDHAALLNSATTKSEERAAELAAALDNAKIEQIQANAVLLERDQAIANLNNILVHREEALSAEKSSLRMQLDVAIAGADSLRLSEGALRKKLDDMLAEQQIAVSDEQILRRYYAASRLEREEVVRAARCAMSEMEDVFKTKLASLA